MNIYSNRNVFFKLFKDLELLKNLNFSACSKKIRKYYFEFYLNQI